MKNWKDKVLGIFAGIGIMSLLMAFNSNSNYQSSGRYQATAVKGGGNQSIIWIVDTSNGKVIQRVQTSGNGALVRVIDY
tara:strand:+ start:641 stop:877 length:237 start_codon:yes stop_codon:yes gene_type:complete